MGHSFVYLVLIWVFDVFSLYQRGPFIHSPQTVVPAKPKHVLIPVGRWEVQVTLWVLLDVGCSAVVQVDSLTQS